MCMCGEKGWVLLEEYLEYKKKLNFWFERSVFDYTAAHLIFKGIFSKIKINLKKYIFYK